jgi:hypothetical protein
MARQVDKTIPITIRLTPDQIREAYQQLLAAEQVEQDWLYEPEVKAEISKRAKKARKEIAQGKAKDWKTVQEEIGA